LLPKVQMMFTDPPYGVEYEGGTKKRDALQGDTSTDLYGEFLSSAVKIVDGPCYMWFADSQAFAVYRAAMQSNCEISALIIWVKNQAQYGNMGAQYKQKHESCLYFKPHGCTLRWAGPNNEVTVWNVSREPANLWHPTQKPVALAYRAIRNHNATSVIDPFMGSGTTLAAAKMHGRQAIGIEIDEKFCKVAADRLRQNVYRSLL
jgi:site-specific DNA-methyltransferase (adenine-specific)